MESHNLILYTISQLVDRFVQTNNDTNDKDILETHFIRGTSLLFEPILHVYTHISHLKLCHSTNSNNLLPIITNKGNNQNDKQNLSDTQSTHRLHKQLSIVNLSSCDDQLECITKLKLFKLDWDKLLAFFIIVKKWNDFTQYHQQILPVLCDQLNDMDTVSHHFSVEQIKLTKIVQDLLTSLPVLLLVSNICSYSTSLTKEQRFADSKYHFKGKKNKHRGKQCQCKYCPYRLDVLSLFNTAYGLSTRCLLHMNFSSLNIIGTASCSQMSSLWSQLLLTCIQCGLKDWDTIKNYWPDAAYDNDVEQNDYFNDIINFVLHDSQQNKENGNHLLSHTDIEMRIIIRLIIIVIGVLTGFIHVVLHTIFLKRDTTPGKLKFTPFNQLLEHLLCNSNMLKLARLLFDFIYMGYTMQQFAWLHEYIMFYSNQTSLDLGQLQNYRITQQNDMSQHSTHQPCESDNHFMSTSVLQTNVLFKSNHVCVNKEYVCREIFYLFISLGSTFRCAFSFVLLATCTDLLDLQNPNLSIKDKLHNHLQDQCHSKSLTCHLTKMSSISLNILELLHNKSSELLLLSSPQLPMLDIIFSCSICMYLYITNVIPKNDALFLGFKSYQQATMSIPRFCFVEDLEIFILSRIFILYGLMHYVFQYDPNHSSTTNIVFTLTDLKTYLKQLVLIGIFYRDTVKQHQLNCIPHDDTYPDNLLQQQLRSICIKKIRLGHYSSSLDAHLFHLFYLSFQLETIYCPARLILLTTQDVSINKFEQQPDITVHWYLNIIWCLLRPWIHYEHQSRLSVNDLTEASHDMHHTSSQPISHQRIQDDPLLIRELKELFNHICSQSDNQVCENQKMISDWNDEHVSNEIMSQKQNRRQHFIYSGRLLKYICNIPLYKKILDQKHEDVEYKIIQIIFKDIYQVYFELITETFIDHENDQKKNIVPTSFNMEYFLDMCYLIESIYIDCHHINYIGVQFYTEHLTRFLLDSILYDSSIILGDHQHSNLSVRHLQNPPNLSCDPVHILNNPILFQTKKNQHRIITNESPLHIIRLPEIKNPNICLIVCGGYCRVLTYLQNQSIQQMYSLYIVLNKLDSASSQQTLLDGMLKQEYCMEQYQEYVNHLLTFVQCKNTIRHNFIRFICWHFGVLLPTPHINKNNPVSHVYYKKYHITQTDFLNDAVGYDLLSNVSLVLQQCLCMSQVYVYSLKEIAIQLELLERLELLFKSFLYALKPIMDDPNHSLFPINTQCKSLQSMERLLWFSWVFFNNTVYSGQSIKLMYDQSKSDEHRDNLTLHNGIRHTKRSVLTTTSIKKKKMSCMACVPLFLTKHSMYNTTVNNKLDNHKHKKIIKDKKPTSCVYDGNKHLSTGHWNHAYYNSILFNFSVQHVIEIMSTHLLSYLAVSSNPHGILSTMSEYVNSITDIDQIIPNNPPIEQDQKNTICCFNCLSSKELSSRCHSFYPCHVYHLRVLFIERELHIKNTQHLSSQISHHRYHNQETDCVFHLNHTLESLETSKKYHRDHSLSSQMQDMESEMKLGLKNRILFSKNNQRIDLDSFTYDDLCFYNCIVERDAREMIRIINVLLHSSHQSYDPLQDLMALYRTLPISKTTIQTSLFPIGELCILKKANFEKICLNNNCVFSHLTLGYLCNTCFYLFKHKTMTPLNTELSQTNNNVQKLINNHTSTNNTSMNATNLIFDEYLTYRIKLLTTCIKQKISSYKECHELLNKQTIVSLQHPAYDHTTICLKLNTTTTTNNNNNMIFIDSYIALFGYYLMHLIKDIIHEYILQNDTDSQSSVIYPSTAKISSIFQGLYTLLIYSPESFIRYNVFYTMFEWIEILELKGRVECYPSPQLLTDCQDDLQFEKFETTQSSPSFFFVKKQNDVNLSCLDRFNVQGLCLVLIIRWINNLTIDSINLLKSWVLINITCEQLPIIGINDLSIQNDDSQENVHLPFALLAILIILVTKEQFFSQTTKKSKIPNALKNKNDIFFQILEKHDFISFELFSNSHNTYQSLIDIYTNKLKDHILTFGHVYERYLSTCTFPIQLSILKVLGTFIERQRLLLIAYHASVPVRYKTLRITNKDSNNTVFSSTESMTIGLNPMKFVPSPLCLIFRSQQIMSNSLVITSSSNQSCLLHQEIHVIFHAATLLLKNDSLNATNPSSIEYFIQHTQQYVSTKYVKKKNEGKNTYDLFYYDDESSSTSNESNLPSSLPLSIDDAVILIGILYVSFIVTVSELKLHEILSNQSKLYQFSTGILFNKHLSILMQHKTSNTISSECLQWLVKCRDLLVKLCFSHDHHIQEKAFLFINWADEIESNILFLIYFINQNYISLASSCSTNQLDFYPTLPDTQQKKKLLIRTSTLSSILLLWQNIQLGLSYYIFEMSIGDITTQQSFFQRLLYHIDPLNSHDNHKQLPYDLHYGFVVSSSVAFYSRLTQYFQTIFSRISPPLITDHDSPLHLYLGHGQYSRYMYYICQFIVTQLSPFYKGIITFSHNHYNICGYNMLKTQRHINHSILTSPSFFYHSHQSQDHLLSCTEPTVLMNQSNCSYTFIQLQLKPSDSSLMTGLFWLLTHLSLCLSRKYQEVEFFLKTEHCSQHYFQTEFKDSTCIPDQSYIVHNTCPSFGYNQLIDFETMKNNKDLLNNSMALQRILSAIFSGSHNDIPSNSQLYVVERTNNYSDLGLYCHINIIRSFYYTHHSFINKSCHNHSQVSKDHGTNSSSVSLKNNKTSQHQGTQRLHSNVKENNLKSSKHLKFQHSRSYSLSVSGGGHSKSQSSVRQFPSFNTIREQRDLKKPYYQTDSQIKHQILHSHKKKIKQDRSTESFNTTPYYHWRYMIASSSIITIMHRFSSDLFWPSNATLKNHQVHLPTLTDSYINHLNKSQQNFVWDQYWVIAGIRELLRTIGYYRRSLRILLGKNQISLNPSRATRAAIEAYDVEHSSSFAQLTLLELLLRDELTRYLAWWGLSPIFSSIGVHFSLEILWNIRIGEISNICSKQGITSTKLLSHSHLLKTKTLALKNNVFKPKYEDKSSKLNKDHTDHTTPKLFSKRKSSVLTIARKQTDHHFKSSKQSSLTHEIHSIKNHIIQHQNQSDDQLTKELSDIPFIDLVNKMSCNSSSIQSVSRDPILPNNDWIRKSTESNLSDENQFLSSHLKDEHDIQTTRQYVDELNNDNITDTQIMEKNQWVWLSPNNYRSSSSSSITSLNGSLVAISDKYNQTFNLSSEPPTNTNIETNKLLHKKSNRFLKRIQFKKLFNCLPLKKSKRVHSGRNSLQTEMLSDKSNDDKMMFSTDHITLQNKHLYKVWNRQKKSFVKLSSYFKIKHSIKMKKVHRANSQLFVQRRGKLPLLSLRLPDQKLKLWTHLLDVAWTISPPILSQLLQRFPTRKSLHHTARKLLSHEPYIALYCSLLCPKMNTHFLDIIASPYSAWIGTTRSPFFHSEGYTHQHKTFQTLRFCYCSKNVTNHVRKSQQYKHSLHNQKKTLVKFPWMYILALPVRTWLPLLHSNHKNDVGVRCLIMRLFQFQPIDIIKHYILQFIQSLAADTGRIIQTYLSDAAMICPSFEHLLRFILSTECTKQHQESVTGSLIESNVLNYISSRLITFLNNDSMCIKYFQSYYKQTIKQEYVHYNPDQQLEFFQKLIQLSGAVLQFPMSQREIQLRLELNKMNVYLESSSPLYLPSNPQLKIVKWFPNDAKLMQSASKAPYLITFEVEPFIGIDEMKQQFIQMVHTLLRRGSTLTNDHNKKNNYFKNHSLPQLNSIQQTSLINITTNHSKSIGDMTQDKIQPCLQHLPPQTSSMIFKLHDDIRQDQLTIEIMFICKKIFKRANLPLYLRPYSVIAYRTGLKDLEFINSNTNGNESCNVIGVLGGMIEVIPESISRHQIGREYECSLEDYFYQKFRYTSSETIKENDYSAELMDSRTIKKKVENKLYNTKTTVQQVNTLSTNQLTKARWEFLRSLAAYSVVSFLLQVKDRHNGNLLITEQGQLLHIDFGFLFDLSPGGDLRFEKAPFKLTSEMINILGGSSQSPLFKLFERFVVQGYLALREDAILFLHLIHMMMKSGLLCFKPQSLKNFRDRFQLGKSPEIAAEFMRHQIEISYNAFSTRLYDVVQAIQQGIAR